MIGAVRTAGPAALIVVEAEAVTRVFATCAEAEDERLAAWVAAVPERAAALAYALMDRDRTGGAGGQVAWTEHLREDALRPWPCDPDDALARLCAELPRT